MREGGALPPRTMWEIAPERSLEAGKETMLRPLCVAVSVIALVGSSGCGASDTESGEPAGAGSGTSIPVVAYEPTFEPSNFSNPTTIDNPLLTWTPEVSRAYLKDENQTLDMSVHDQPVTHGGLECLQVSSNVHDESVATLENRYAFYAQDDAGNVWCLGEEVWGPDEFDDSRSWEAGVDGALPGIAMPAAASVGLTYRQGYSANHAEDWAQIIDIDVDVPATRYLPAFSGCVKTTNWSALSPERIENRVYCPEVGMVSAEVVEGGTGLVELWDAD
jgi:hypothetical protein